MNNKPLITLGLPVYNGEKFLQATLDSILAQTFENFELIISDNGSTDRTQKICEQYLVKDQRIRYYRNDKNLGAAKNYNRLLELALGEYFKWAAHDDICAPNFLLRCVEILDKDSSVVLCLPKTMLIDEHGKFLYNCKHKLNTNSIKLQERFDSLLLSHHACYQIFGVMRTSTLRMTPGLGSYVGSDLGLLAELSLHGRFYEVPELLFLRRKHQETSVAAFGAMRNRLAWFDPTKSGQISFPTTRRFMELCKSIARAPLSLSERLSCFLSLGKWLVVRKKLLGMGKDLALAANTAFNLTRLKIRIGKRKGSQFT